MTRLATLMASKPDETREGIDLLVTLPWESERTDLHGIALAKYGHDASTGEYVKLECYCGGVLAAGKSADEALTLMEDHAITTCAACHGPKAANTFPRCAGSTR